MPEDKTKVVAEPKADTKVGSGKDASPSADAGLVPAADLAGEKVEGGTSRLRDPEPVADSDLPADAEPAPEDHTITNEPVEDQAGNLRNPKPEALGAVGDLDPKGRSPEEFKAAQRKSEARHMKRIHTRRAARREEAAIAA